MFNNITSTPRMWSFHSLVSMLGTQGWRYDFVALQDEGYGNPNKSGRASGGVPSIPESHLWGPATWQAHPGLPLKGSCLCRRCPKVCWACPWRTSRSAPWCGEGTQSVQVPWQNYPRPDTLWGCQVHIELWLFACDSEGHGNGLI